MPPWLSPLCLIPGKNIQLGIMVFLKVQEVNLQVNIQGSKCDVYFYEELKVPFPFDPVAFFRNTVTSTPRDVFK